MKNTYLWFEYGCDKNFTFWIRISGLIRTGLVRTVWVSLLCYELGVWDDALLFGYWRGKKSMLSHYIFWRKKKLWNSNTKNVLLFPVPRWRFSSPVWTACGTYTSNLLSPVTATTVRKIKRTPVRPVFNNKTFKFQNNAFPTENTFSIFLT